MKKSRKKKYNSVGIILARGGSKAVPKKNIKKLAGKPLIAYTIEAALKSKLDRVIVSTDCKEIAEVSRRYGAEVPFMRPAKLATDTAHSRPVLVHAINYLEKTEKYPVDIVVMLQPTSPLREACDIDAGLEKLVKTRADSVTSICETEYPPYWVKTLKGDKLDRFVKSKIDYDQLERQQLPKTYQLNGAIFVTWKHIIMKQKQILGKDTRAIFMESERSMDIDTELDFGIIEKMMGGNKKKNVKIRNRVIGNGRPCFIIAEAGVNHNGSMKLAKKLIDKAKDAGADAIKFQNFNTEKLVLKSSPKAEYQVKRTGKKESQYEMLKRLEISKKQTRELMKYCAKKRIIFLSTPYDNESADLLEELGAPAFKIASCDLTNTPLLRYVAKKKKPIILSTGMSTMLEIENAVQEIEKTGNTRIILLHCVTDYPAKLEEINLNALNSLRNNFDFPIGYSDHTMSPAVSLASVSMGSTVLEKHFTLSRKMKGPDHSASIEPAGLKKLVKNIRAIEKSLGKEIKMPTKSERSNRKNMRRSLFAKIDIPAKTVITEDMISVKRPTTGMSPADYDLVIGSTSRAKIRENMPITAQKIIQERMS